MATVMKHYAGRVFAWDVVNEARDENGHFKDSPWYNQPGIGLGGKGSAYVEQAFRWAHEADPDALLFYNENGAEGLGRKQRRCFLHGEKLQSPRGSHRRSGVANAYLSI
jgi:endo-1,4-beta-xylanase